MMDSTSVMAVVLPTLQEWHDQHIKGKVILHHDGNDVKRVEVNYYLEI
jgi:hypothetical protein